MKVMQTSSWMLGLFVAVAIGCHSDPEITAKTQHEKPLKVLILGDSISIGYTQPLRDRLGDTAMVLRPMRSDGSRPENCEGTTKGVKAIDRWLEIDGGDFDVIHFNFGLHDIKHIDPDTGRASMDPAAPRQASLEAYTQQLTAIVDRLQKTNAILIFATTTPVPEGGVRPYRDPSDVPAYNHAAQMLMEDRGIVVNDLFCFANIRLSEIQQPVNVHFTREGSVVLAGEVAQVIRANAPAR